MGCVLYVVLYLIFISSVFFFGFGGYNSFVSRTVKNNKTALTKQKTVRTHSQMVYKHCFFECTMSVCVCICVDLYDKIRLLTLS